MEHKFKLFRLLSIAAASISLLAGCNSPSSEDTIDVDGHPALYSLKRDKNLAIPEWFDDSIVYKDEDANQKEKFIFDAKPGESIAIQNPSPHAISEEEVNRQVKIRDAYFSSEQYQEKGPSFAHSLMAGSPYKKYKLLDSLTSREVNEISPNQKVFLKLDEGTKGGDLTIYEKEAGSPLNFDGKDPSVNELIVATEREDVEEFDPNDETILGLEYSKCVDTMDLTHSVEGQFIYSEDVKLNSGDQFYIGDNAEFDNTATFYTFLGKDVHPQGYLIHYTVPDYSLCYDKFDIHQKETEVDLNTLDEAKIIQEVNEKKDELIRGLDADGKVTNLINESVEGELRDNESLAREVFGKDWNPSINLMLTISSFIVSVAISFNFGGPAFCMNFKIGFSTLISRESYGSWILSGSVDLFFRKTFSTYADFSISLIPYPKINYIVAVKTVSEWSFNFYLGVSYGMKPADPKVDKKQEVEELSKDIEEAMGEAEPIKGDPSGDNPPEVAEEAPSLDPSMNVVDGEENLEPILAYNPKEVFAGDDHDYGDDKLGKKRYSGLGIVVSGPGIPLNIGPVSIEVGMSVTFMPDIQGRFFVAYNHVSCEVTAKVVKGFDTPEGYGDDVEYARSRFVVGLYVKLGFEVGFMLELMVYITGSKHIFYAAVQGTFGIYFNIQGVGCIIFGSEVDTTFMVYASIEIGLFCRINIVLNILSDKHMVTFKAFEYKWPPFFAFGSNLHFLQFIKGKEEFEWAGGRYLDINEMGILNLIWFSTKTFSVGDQSFTWDHREFFAAAGGAIYKRLFKKLEILEGGSYISFNDVSGRFEVSVNAPISFDFKFKVSIDPWLGCTCDPKTFTVHYYSNLIRAIGFEGFSSPYEKDGVYVGGGLLTQGAIYEAPNMPNKEDGTPFVGWLGNNGLFLKPGERMEVGANNITFTPVYMTPVTYRVQFYDGYNNLISTQNIAPGGMAVEPNPEARDAKMGGARFVGWDRAFDDVHSSFNVYGIYVTGGKLS